MANKRIGQTTNRSTTTATDLIPFERSNAMNNITQADFMGDVEDYLAAATKTIVSKTYAQWEVIRAASGLDIYFNTWVFVSDKSVYLTPVAVNQFALNGIWKNTVSAVDYYNECGFDFLFTLYGNTGRFIYIKDHLQNVVYNGGISNNNTPNFKFNQESPTIICNVVDSDGNIDLTGALGSINNNKASSSGSLLATNTLVTSVVENNEITCDSILTVTGTNGSILSNKLDQDAEVTIILNSGITIEKCSFSAITTTLNPATSYSDKSVRKGYSDFDVTITQTGLTTLTNHATYGAHVGIFNITSTNATETINLFANAPTNHPFWIVPEADITALIITHGTSANQPHNKEGRTHTLDGSKGDRIQYTYDATLGHYYESAIFTNEATPVGEISWSGNATAIDVAVAGTYVVVNNTTTLDAGVYFDSPSGGRLRYIGLNPTYFHVECNFSVSHASANADLMNVQLRKNGTQLQNSIAEFSMNPAANVSVPVSIAKAVLMSTNDYIELYVTNQSSSAANRDPIFESLTLTAIE